MKNKVIYIHNLISVICLAVLLCLGVVFGAFRSNTVNLGACGSSTTVYAAENNDDVLIDLQRDETFDKDKYPYKPEVTYLKVITVAEGEGDQLFVYVYNPSMNSLYNATYIRLSPTIGENYAPQDYGLTLVSSSGVFQKYYVKNFVVKSYSQRYYDITCIFRKFVENIDKDCETETKNNVDQVPFEVATCFTATTVNGEVSYSKEYVDAVTVTDKYVFNGKYPDGFEWYGIYLSSHKTVAHIIAFSTNWDIQNLFEIDIEYTTRSFTHTWQESSANGYQPMNEKFVLGDESLPVTKTIYAQDKDGNDITVSNPGKDSGWMFGHTYTWKRVQTASSFVDTLADKKIKLFDDVALSKIENKQWVVAFAETEYTYEDVAYPVLDSSVSECTEKGSKVENVSLMRFKFKSKGKTYNLGVVDNYQTGSLDSVFEGKNELELFADKFAEFWEMFVKVIFLIVGVILLVLLLNFVAPVMSIFKYMFKAIKFVISLPFKVIKWVFRIGNKKDG